MIRKGKRCSRSATSPEAPMYRNGDNYPSEAPITKKTCSREAHMKCRCIYRLSVDSINWALSHFGNYHQFSGETMRHSRLMINIAVVVVDRDDLV